MGWDDDVPCWDDDVPCWDDNVPCWLVPEVDWVDVWAFAGGKRFASHANWSVEKGGGCSIGAGLLIVSGITRIRMVKGFSLGDLCEWRAQTGGRYAHVQGYDVLC